MEEFAAYQFSQGSTKRGKIGGQKEGQSGCISTTSHIQVDEQRRLEL